MDNLAQIPQTSTIAPVTGVTQGQELGSISRASQGTGFILGPSLEETCVRRPCVIRHFIVRRTIIWRWAEMGRKEKKKKKILQCKGREGLTR